MSAEIKSYVELMQENKLLKKNVYDLQGQLTEAYKRIAELSTQKENKT